MIVQPEVHKKENYERWCIFMQHYLVAQDLWDVVLSSEMPDGEDPREWIKKNALALYAIKISCGAEKFDRIKEINSAKDAWNALADLHKQPNEDGNKDTGIKTVERKQAVTLLKDIEKGDSDAVKKLLETHSSYSARALENGSTALHVAITAGKIELAKELISVMSEAGELETQNKSGKTVLHLAACKGSREIVECLVAKNKKLLEIPDCEKKIPLVLACATHHKCLTLYLYSVTPIEILDPVNGDHGFFLLRECLRNRMFEIGLDLLCKFPDLTFHKSSLEPTPIISELVQVLSSLFAGIWYKHVPFWEWPLMVYIPFCKVPIIEALLVGDKWKTLPEKPGRLKAYNLKYDRAYAREMVHFICEQLSTLERDQLLRSGAVEATFKAIKLGYLDFVKQIIEANPDMVWSHDPEHSRDMLMYAVAHRQKEIAKFLYGHNAWRNMTEFTTDDDQNNMLHLVAKLPPSSPHIHHLSDPVLQMQSEAKWFAAVAHIVPTFYKGQRNKIGETPSEMFSKEHQDLLKEAQTWVKETASFAAVIGTLIVGTMFAAGITVPGGNNEQDGLPIFSKGGYFRLFIGWDLLAVYLASLSVVLFLDIHKSRLTEEDFLSGFLIFKLAMSFYFLFSSMGIMLICCFASMKLVNPKRITPYNIATFILFGCPYVCIFVKHLLPLIKTLYPIFFKTESKVLTCSQISSLKKFPILRQCICG
ncbi:hypothetical protein SLEP1_g42680 [Rubroshorea leprosula]|uniref:PGG domain-containing protein n=1 Tax=Rubroshorea leprosula TaxID=152421 RepID=A0AAV5LAP9_9ROSI|nr:hypothetical protein SLEP1_g42680 [Rubroshorea leprosula]